MNKSLVIVAALERLQSLSAKGEEYVIKNGDRYLQGSFQGGGQPHWVKDISKATRIPGRGKEFQDAKSSASMRGMKLVKV